MKIGNRNFNKNKTYVMGILNVTPDSFSDGGKFNSIDNALRHTEKMIDEGADIIDVGGESTKPGYTVISEKEEIERTIPIIYNIKRKFDIPVSIDTYKSEVARAALDAGADLVNDIWGFKYSPEMPDLVRKYNAACCLMHNKGDTKYKDFINDVLRDLKESIGIALSSGISENKIIIDPGIGFGKTYENNIEIIRNMERLLELNLPVLFAASRKSVIGLTLNLPVDERLEGTLATTVIAVLKGCSFVRVHDVKENKRVINMTEKIIGRF